MKLLTSKASKVNKVLVTYITEKPQTRRKTEM